MSSGLNFLLFVIDSSVGRAPACSFFSPQTFLSLQNKAESSGREVEEVSDKVAKGVADYFDDYGISYKIAHFEGIKNLLLKRDSDFLL